MSAYDAAAWQGFYVMIGGAAAALTGLLFVAMSLHEPAFWDLVLGAYADVAGGVHT